MKKGFLSKAAVVATAGALVLTGCASVDEDVSDSYVRNLLHDNQHNPQDLVGRYHVISGDGRDLGVIFIESTTQEEDGRLLQICANYTAASLDGGAKSLESDPREACTNVEPTLE